MKLFDSLKDLFTDTLSPEEEKALKIVKELFSKDVLIVCKDIEHEMYHHSYIDFSRTDFSASLHYRSFYYTGAEIGGHGASFTLKDNTTGESIILSRNRIYDPVWKIAFEYKVNREKKNPAPILTTINHDVKVENGKLIIDVEKSADPIIREIEVNIITPMDGGQKTVSRNIEI